MQGELMLSHISGYTAHLSANLDFANLRLRGLLKDSLQVFFLIG